MEFALSEEQRQFKDSARNFLNKQCAPSRVRQIMADDDGMPRDLYAQMAALGWSGLIIPEAFEGAGLGMLEMSLLLEECGYAALPGPLLFSSALATAAIVNGGSDELKHRWLGRLAQGGATGTIAIVEPGDSLDPADLKTTAQPQGLDFALTGTKMFVPYAQVADFIVVAARTGPASDNVGLFVVDSHADGVKIRRLSNLDLTRRVYLVQLDNVRVQREACLEGGLRFYNRLIDTASVAIAADSLGGTERALEMAVEYSKVREQFGKPIGSFQALKHAAAEIVADLEPARALLWFAAYAYDSLPDEAAKAAAMVKARLCEVYMRGSDRAVLMHGGIGFTWDHDIHLWFKRARFNESYFGSPAFHRERLARLSDY